MRGPAGGALLLVALLSGCARPPVELPLPAPGAPVAQRLAAGDTHRYDVCLAAGEFVHLVFEQGQVDVVVDVRDPTGQALPELDTVTFAEVPEDVPLVAEEEGCFLVDVAEWGGEGETAKGGEYGARLAARRPAVAADRSFTAAVYDHQRAMALEAEARADLLARAADGFAAYGATWREGNARRELSKAYDDLGHAAEALREAQRAVELHTQSGASYDLARSLNDRAVARRRTCDIDGARADHEMALVLLEEARQWKDVAAAWRDLAFLNRLAGRLQDSRDVLERALEIGERHGSQPGQLARTLDSLGEAFLLLGDPARAETSFARARELRDEEPENAVSSLDLDLELEREGWILHLRGEHLKAEERLRRAVAALEGEESSYRRGVVRNTLGRVLIAQGRYDEARSELQRALEHYRAGSEEDFIDGAGVVLANLGRLELLVGDEQAALRWHRQALAELEQCPRLLKGIENRAGIARTFAQLGELEAARAYLDEAIADIAALRSDPHSLAARRDLFRGWRTVYEVAVDLDLAAAEADAAGAVTSAFERFERLQERSMLDLFAAGRLADDPDRAALIEQVKQAFRDVVEAEREGRSAVEAERRLRELRWELFDRATLPPAARHAEPSSLRQIREALPDDAVLAGFYLGAERGALWLVDRHSGFRLYPLPARSEVALRVRRLLRFVESEPRSTVDEEAAKLADLLFPGDALERLRGRRLWIVADEELDVLPWGLLRVRVPGGGREYLAVRHEHATIPSASSLVLFGERPGRRSSGRTVVLADPLLGGASGEGRTEAWRGSLRDFDPRALPPLPGTRQEAASIRSILGTGNVEVRLGRRVDRSTVLDGSLASAPLIHFATHALLPANPDLAGLVLSPDPATGDDGFLQAFEIAALELRAQLVVLAACDTGTQGLSGLPEAFLTAGARSVLVSLWQLRDGATAELMERFYRHLARGRPAAAALRAAQREMAGVRGSHPRDWAGFTLVGDPAAAPIPALD